MAFENLQEKLGKVFTRLRGRGKLSEGDIRSAMREVKLALLEADVNVKVVNDFVRTVSEKALGAEVHESLNPAQQVIKIVNEELTAMMGGQNARVNMASKGPTVIMMVGLQGAGKTTNGAKLAAYFKETLKKRPLLVACDVYRPAAIKQLQVVGEQVGVPVFEMGQGNPVEIARKGLAHANLNGNDLVILVKFNHAKRSGILYGVTKYRSTLFICHSILKKLGKVRTVKYVISKNEAYAVIADKFFTKYKRICESSRSFLNLVGDFNTDLLTCSEKLFINRGILGGGYDQNLSDTCEKQS